MPMPPKPKTKKTETPAEPYKKIKHKVWFEYEDRPDWCYGWIMLRDGPATSSALFGNMTRKTADKVAASIGLPVVLRKVVK